MLGTVFHYAVVAPKDDHADCLRQRDEIIAYHERIGYRRGGAYNGHFCWHGESWLSYEGPNQATGNTWANLNLEAWCYLATTDTPVTDAAARVAYDLTLRNPREEIYPHSAFFNTSCCGDPLREWIANGALPPAAPDPTPVLVQEDDMRLIKDTDTGKWWLWLGGGYTWEEVSPAMAYVLGYGAKIPVGEMRGNEVSELANICARQREWLRG